MKKGRTGYRRGDPFKLCDICSCRFYASEIKPQWNGSEACLKCWNERPGFIYDKIPTFPNEMRSIPNPRHEPEENYIDDTLPPDTSNL